MIISLHIRSTFLIVINPIKIGFNLERSQDLLTQKDHLCHFPSFRFTRTYTRTHVKLVCYSRGFYYTMPTYRIE